MKKEANGGYMVAEKNRVLLRDSSCVERLGDCGVCLSYREIVADGCSFCLPVSGELLVDKLDHWWSFKGPSPENGPERLVRATELPMCQACLDLAEDIEQIEHSLETRLKGMWTRLRAGKLVVPDSRGQEEPRGDVVQAAALAAGILDDFGSPGMASPAHRSPRPAKAVKQATPPPPPAPSPPPPSPPPPPPLANLLPPDDASSATPNLVVRKVSGRRTSVRNATKRSTRKDEDEAEEEQVPTKKKPEKRVTRASKNGGKKTRDVNEEQNDATERKDDVTKEGDGNDLDYGTIVVTRIKQEVDVPEEKLIPDLEMQQYDEPENVEKKLGPKKKRQSKKRRTSETINDMSTPGEEQEPPMKKDRRRSSKWYNTERMCPICGLILKAGGNHAVEKHISVVHNRDKTLQCQFCTEKFTYHENLYAHQAKVHQYKTERIARPCEHCGKVITSRWGMRQHLLNVHGILREGHKVYECPRCQRKFLSLRNFKDHVNSHDGVRPYGCPLCEVRMVKFDNLRQHVKRVHKKDVRLVRDTDAAGGAACELITDDGEVDNSSAALQAQMIEAQVVGTAANVRHQQQQQQQQQQILHQVGTIQPKLEEGVQIVEISGLQEVLNVDPNTHHVILEEVVHDGGQGQSVQTQTIIINPLHAIG